MSNNCRAIHETIIRDLIDAVDMIRDTDAEDILDRSKRSPFASTSLTRMTDNLVCVFPVMVSTSLSIDTSIMIMKAIERKGVVMLQLLFAAYQVTNQEDLASVINQFHKNIKLNDKMGVDDVIAVMDTIGESVDMKKNYAMIEAVRRDMKNINFYFEQNVNPSSLNDISVKKDPYQGFVMEGFGGNRRDGNGVRKTTELTNSDIKKANELVPSMITVNLTYKNDNGDNIKIESAVIGVKARLIPVASNDIINHLMTKVQDRNWLLQLIRATTREISFTKDFLFAIDRAKIDALAHSRRGSSNPMWKVLERRAMGSKLKRLIGASNNYMAITTLAVSQEDVDYAQKQFNTDFSDPSVIDPLFTNLNLMCVCIADESLEVAKFMFDTGDGNWENYSFTSLEREDKDNTYKKVINLMTKVAR